MSTASQGSAYHFAMEVMQHVLKRMERYGERNGYIQLFQPENATDDSTDSEMEVEQLGRAQAREFIGERIKAGFRGFAALSCIERDGTGLFLRVEGFNTADGRSASIRFPLKKTMMGKLKAVGTDAELDDFPTIPGAFPVSTDAEAGADS